MELRFNSSSLVITEKVFGKVSATIYESAQKYVTYSCATWRNNLYAIKIKPPSIKIADKD